MFSSSLSVQGRRASQSGRHQGDSASPSSTICTLPIYTPTKCSPSAPACWHLKRRSTHSKRECGN
eukprot:5236963-Prymnesium_polylepis.1